MSEKDLLVKDRIQKPCDAALKAEEYVHLLLHKCKEEIITFKQWAHTDRTTIASLQLPLHEFLEEIPDAFKHYVISILSQNPNPQPAKPQGESLQR